MSVTALLRFNLCYIKVVLDRVFYFSLGEPLAEMELCSRPFEPELDHTSGGKLKKQVHFISDTFFQPVHLQIDERVFMFSLSCLKE